MSAFLEIDGYDKVNLAWLIGLHLTFVVSGVFLALMDRISGKEHG